MKSLHYGWVIVGCAFLTLMISNGMTLVGLTAFDKDLIETFGWGKGELKLREFIQFTLAGLLGPFIGALADKYGVRRLMILGMAFLAAGLFAYSYIESLTHIYLIHILLGGTLGCAGLVVNILLVSRWFSAKRGTAIGLALVGTSLGNTLFGAVNGAIIANTSWQEAFRWVALLPLLAIPVIFLLVKELPADKGLAPYGADDAAPAPTNPDELPGMDFGAALRHRNFWALALAAMMTFYAVLGAASHLFLYYTKDGGVPLAKAGGMVGMVFLFGLFGKFIFGYLADHVDPKKVFIGNLAVMFAGSLFLASMNMAYYWPFVILFGFGWGGLYTMIQLLVVDSFGVRCAGRILGAITVLDALGGGLGPWITGVLYDQTGSYQTPFLVIAALVAASLGMALILKPPQAMKA